MNSQSFYIPSVSVLYNFADVSAVFQQQRLGTVRRVDFVPFKVPHPDFQSMFVHCTDMDSRMIDIINNSPTGYKMYIHGNRYWILLKNKNPVADTHLNIHQIAENARLLELRVADQEKLIVDQRVAIERLQETVYQVIGKAFNQETEMPLIFSNVNYMFYGDHCSTHWLPSIKNMEIEPHVYDFEEEIEGYDSN